MLIEIKHRFRSAVLFALDQEENSPKITLEAAVKAGANLQDANLQGADLQGANLQDAYLQGANLQDANLRGAYLQGANMENCTYGEGVLLGAEPLFLTGLKWEVYVFQDHIKIGCQLRAKQEWAVFTDEEIRRMDGGALEFWVKWKQPILALAGVEVAT